MSRRAASRGFSLIESMIAVVVLCFGVLGLTRLQAGMMAQGIDSQRRMAATGLAEDLLSLARVDAATNAPCYTWPAQGACASVPAQTLVSAWATRVTAAGFSAPTVTYVGTQLKLSMSWAGKVARDAHQFEVITDVRP